MNVDLDLELTCKEIKENLVKDIKGLARNGEILNMEPFPSPHILALLARAAYTDIVAELPEGWKYLTAAFNRSKENGYFGVAYWRPSLQQVVIAHRGTEITNLGDLLTNSMGVMNTKYTPQMNSAITFADIIMTELYEMNKEEGVDLQLSLTGHSLGGWLAQVTAFTLEYIQRDGDDFVKIIERLHGRHVHTVTFDSPGCGDMLKKIIDDGYYRYKEKVSPDHLDITNYLAPPNRINTTGSHVGMICVVCLDLSKFGTMDKHTLLYNLATHKIDNFVEAFVSKRRINRVLDWPVSSDMLGGKEYKEFHATANHATSYIPDLEAEGRDILKKKLRYKTENEEEISCNLRVFSEKELYLLDLWFALKTEKVKMIDISDFVKRHNLGTVDGLFSDFEIDTKNRTVTCQSKKCLQALVRHTKQLMNRFYPEFLEAVERESGQVPRAGPLIYRMVAQNYLDSLPECHIHFKDTIGLNVFLETSETRILHIKTEDSQFEVIRLYNLLSQMREISQAEHRYLRHDHQQKDIYLQHDHQTFVDWEKMQDLDQTVDFESFYKSGYSCDDLLVIDSAVACLHLGIFKRFLNNVNKKLIIISSTKRDHKRFLESLKVPFKTVPCAPVTLCDLTEESQIELFSRKMLTISGKQFALGDYTEIQNLSSLLSHINCYIDRQMFKGIVTDQKFTIKIEGAPLYQDDLKVHSTLNKEVSVARISQVLHKRSRDALLVISGIGREKLRTDRWKELVHSMGEERIFTTTKDGESIFNQICREKPCKTVYWLAASAEQVSCKIIYENGFYMKRRWRSHQFIFNIEKFAKNINNQNAIFVFQNVESKKFLMNQCSSIDNKKTFLESSLIKTAASVKEVDDIIKENPNMPVHVLNQEADGSSILWQRSRGTLEGLRPYITADIGESIDEQNLCNTTQKVVIIADEPGMGKSTSLTSVSRLLRSAWVIRVDLKDFHIPIQNLPTKLSLNSVCEFILRNEDNILRGLLQFCLDKQNKNSREIYILFDGFDEIKEDYSSIKNSAVSDVLRLFTFLNNETAARIWVTTRLYKKENLENAFSIFAMKFEKICESQQWEYLMKFWHSHLLLVLENHNEDEDTLEKKLEKCAKYLFENAKKVLGGDIQNFMGIPLQMRMLADVFMQRVLDYIKSDTNIENTFNVKSVLDLYQQFIDLKYEIYFRDKTGLNVGMSSQFKEASVNRLLTENHRMLGLCTLFPQFAKENFDDPEDGWGVELCRIGLVQSGKDGSENIEFIHRTLAEYYCADLAVGWLHKKGRYHGQAPMLELLLTNILLQDSSKVTRTFINNLVLLQPLSEEVVKFITLKICELWREKSHVLFNYHKSALHIAVEEGSEGIADILVRSFKCEPVQLIAFMAAVDHNGDTALGLAAQKASNSNSHNKIMMKIVQSIESCPYEVILELLITTYMRFKTLYGNPFEIKLLGNYLEGEAASSEIKKAFIRTQTVRQNMPLFREAVRKNRVKDVVKLYHKMENDIERRYMLLGPNSEKDNILHQLFAADDDKLIKMQKQIIEIVCSQDISRIGRSYNSQGQTPLHCAAEAGNLDIFKHLIKHKVCIDSLLSKDGETALFSAARKGRLPLVKYLVEKGAAINILNKKGENALSVAAHEGQFRVVEYLFDKGVDITTDEVGDTVLFDAARNGSHQLVKYLLDNGTYINILNENDETALFNGARNDNFPLAKYLIDKGVDINILNKDGCTALFYAVQCGRIRLVEYLIEKGTDINILDKEGCTILFYAVDSGSLPLVEYLTEKGVDINISERSGKTAVDRAIEKGYRPVVKFLKEKLKTQDKVKKRKRLSFHIQGLVQGVRGTVSSPGIEK